MTVAAAQARLMTLTLNKSDLEYRLTCLAARQQQLANISSAYAQAYAEAGITDIQNTPQMLAIQAQEKAMEAERKTLETQDQATTTNLESIQKLVENNVKKDFKLNFGS